MKQKIKTQPFRQLKRRTCSICHRRTFYWCLDALEECLGYDQCYCLDCGAELGGFQNKENFLASLKKT